MDNKAKIACCNICLLSDSMKVCATCPFNPANMKLTAGELDTVSKMPIQKEHNK